MRGSPPGPLAGSGCRREARAAARGRCGPAAKARATNRDACLSPAPAPTLARGQTDPEVAEHSAGSAALGPQASAWHPRLRRAQPPRLAAGSPQGRAGGRGPLRAIWSRRQSRPEQPKGRGSWGRRSPQEPVALGDPSSPTVAAGAQQCTCRPQEARPPRDPHAGPDPLLRIATSLPGPPRTAAHWGASWAPPRQGARPLGDTAAPDSCGAPQPIRPDPARGTWVSAMPLIGQKRGRWHRPHLSKAEGEGDNPGE
jgi:hypothetical protein